MTAKTVFDKKSFFSWIQIIAGAVIAAFALEEFLSPNNIFDGGVFLGLGDRGKSY